MTIVHAFRRVARGYDVTTFIVDCLLACAVISLLGEFWRWLSA